MNKPKRKRLNLELSAQAYEFLQELSDVSGKNMAEILRTGLALYGMAEEAKQQGRSLAIVEDEKVVKEILIP